MGWLWRERLLDLAGCGAWGWTARRYIRYGNYIDTLT